MSGRSFGRLPSPPDTRDWSASRLVAMIEAGEAVPVAWDCPVVLDQGTTPHCCGFAAAGFKAAAQVGAPTDNTISDAEGHRLYYACKVVDGEPGSETGSYIRTVAKVLKAEGTIDAYAFGSFAEAQEWCRRYGPVIIGVNWYTGMMRPSNGIIHVYGELEGGHAILWRGTEQVPEENLLHNSWGTDWQGSHGGMAFLSDPDLARLIDLENGEALLAVRRIGKPWSDWPAGNEEEAALWCKERGVMRGYPDGSFHPWQNLTYRQVDLIAGRVGLNAPKEWRERYTACTRGDVRDTFPGFSWLEERWDEPLTRFQMLLLVYRYLKE